MNSEEFEALAGRLRTAAKAYYDTDQLTMTDAEYDDGIEQLRMAVAEHVDWAPTVADLLEQVGAGQSAGGDVVHPRPMLSMAKANSLGGVEAFLEKVQGPVTVEPKLDGLAIRAVYRHGRLAQVVTRGDGQSGEDVTGQARSIAGLPARLDEPISIEVRGEVFITDADFPVANRNRVAAGKPAFVNPRNAVAGSLRNTEYDHAVPMTFAAYDCEGDLGLAEDDAASHAARMVYLHRHLGFGTAADLTQITELASDMAGVQAQIEQFDRVRTELGFPIDGVVVKADQDADRQRLGEGNHSPRWAIAYKFAAETATTVVRAIDTSVGRTGRLALRARVDPVFVGGATVTYASLHNVSWLSERDIRVGDTVTIKRANDVIPYIESADLDKRPPDTEPWQPPATDPLGNEWDKTTLLWRSTSPELSVLGRVVYACSRDCFDIEGIGIEVATALVEGSASAVADDVDLAGGEGTDQSSGDRPAQGPAAGSGQGPLVGDVGDLFSLTESDLATLDLAGRALGSKTAAKIAAEIDKARSAPYNRVITALGIRMTGRTTGRRLAAAFPTMAQLQAASVQELAEVDGIGPVKAKVIHEGLAQAREVIAKLAAAGVTMGDQRPAEAELPLAGKTVVVTGAMSGPLADLSRNEMNELIEAAGGKASGSVSAKTSLLVSGQAGSSKYRKAQELGIEIVSPEEFAELIEYRAGEAASRQ